MSNIIAHTIVNGHLISTVKLPGAQFWPELFGDLMYETMVFEVNDEGEVTDWTEKYVTRYSTHDEAVIGHESVVSEWSVKTVTQ